MYQGGRRGRIRMVVEFTNTYAISCEFESRLWRGVLDTTLCDSLLLTCDRSVSFPGTPVPYTNKTDHHDITEIVLIVTINTINQTITLLICFEIFTIFELSCKNLLKTNYEQTI